MSIFRFYKRAPFGLKSQRHEKKEEGGVEYGSSLFVLCVCSGKEIEGYSIGKSSTTLKWNKPLLGFLWSGLELGRECASLIDFIDDLNCRSCFQCHFFYLGGSSCLHKVHPLFFIGAF